MWRALVASVVVLSAGLMHAQDPAPFVARTDVVALQVSVHDSRGGWISGLDKSAFKVVEDGRPQDISVFAAGDSPVTVGLLIDNSVSMHESRALIIEAATQFSTVSHPDDELFALAFNEHVRPVLPDDAPFATTASAFNQALLTAISARGQTALFDAIDAGFTYAERGRHSRKVLVVISDGGDNASTQTFADILTKARSGPAVIYGVALVDPLDTSARPERLADLARVTGGVSYRPRGAREVATMLRRVAAEIRQTYTLGYQSDRPSDGTFRSVTVSVTPPDKRKVTVRTRAGYTARSAPDVLPSH